MNGYVRGVVSSLCIGALSLLAGELAAAGYFAAVTEGGAGGARTRRTMLAEFRSAVDKLTEADLQRIRTRWHDRELGFTVKPGIEERGINAVGVEYQWSSDNLGRRTHPAVSSDWAISTYGDSFTFCDEVNDDQTWPYALQQISGRQVSNFGVGCFGTDQALLRLLKNRESGLDTAAVSILAIYGENINRTESAYLGFYMPGTVIFKPKFVKHGEEWELIPNPLSELRSRDDFHQAMERALPHDYWYWAHYPGEPRFPFLKAAVELVSYQRELRRVATHKSLWQNPESYQRMRMLVNRFVEAGNQWSFRPIVLMIPSHADMQELLASRPAWYGDFQREIASVKGLVVVDAAELRHRVQSFYIGDLRGHASPATNRVIGEALAQAIVKSRGDR